MHAAAAAKRLAGKQRKQIAYFLEEQWTEQQAESGVCGALIGCQGQDLYRAEKKHNPPEEILWNGSAAAVESGGVLGESVNLTRRLVNEPANMIYPESFAEQASQAAQACGFSIEIWDQAKLEQENDESKEDTKFPVDNHGARLEGEKNSKDTQKNEDKRRKR